VFIEHGASAVTSEVQQYDRKGRLTARAVYQASKRASNNPLAAWCAGYRYSNEGDLLEIRDTQRGRRMFEVDAAHRLVAEIGFDGHRIGYPLDEAGNVLSKPGLVLAKITTGNRLLHADAETFTYDERDHIVERVRGIDNPDAPRIRYEHDSRISGEGHSRSSEFPSGYRQDTHDTMAARHTLEGQAAGGTPVDANGDRSSHDQLHWVDESRQPIDYYNENGDRNLTYDHERRQPIPTPAKRQPIRPVVIPIAKPATTFTTILTT